ncbi:transcriptional regulator [Embleya sp. NPDC050493]|uniref:transcriptional regulator n=1 Tax=Embleya sp. NPDC050493 TaxID=3363989 RepID=UPI0037A4D0FA
MALSTTSLGDWFKGSVVPADPGRFAFLVTWLEHEAHRLDNAYVPTPVAAWERLRGEAVRERRPAGRPHATRTGERSVEGEGFVGRPVREFTDPFALEVHRAIDAPEHTRNRLPVLPVYVPRDHDQVLRDAVERAAGGESVMVTLVAGSSTGKTRACWEALQGVPDGWRLWHPLYPSPAEAAAAGLSRVGPRTVVWLNEAQTYLESADVGQRIATGLRELLDDPRRGPVLVLATLWPDPFWSTLTTRPPASAPDPHAHARSLLTGTDLRVPDAFAGPDLEAVRARAGEDPRLANALASGDDGRVTQFLAGALALLKRYELAPAGGRSVLEAAMDARRLGHGPVLKQAFLEDAADAYLTDDESDALTDDWFEQALAYATGRVQGTTAPLTRIRPRRRHHGDPGEGPTYRLADYLEQHAHHARHAHCPGASFWNAAHDHAHTPDGLLNLADAAHRRLRLRHAEHLYGKAANTQDSRALARLAGLRERAGDHEGAERLAREATDAGNTHSLKQPAGLGERTENRERAGNWVHEAASITEILALMRPIALRVQAGDQDGAERLAREATDAGNTKPLLLLILMREQAGDQDGAERLAREAADAGNTEPLEFLITMRVRAGDQDGAERLAREAADAGNTEPRDLLITMRVRAGDQDGAERLARETTEAGNTLDRLVALREEAGDHEGAECLAREAADAGNTEPLNLLITIRERTGDHEGAERLAHEATDCETTLQFLVAVREQAGDHEGAERLAHQTAHTGNTPALSFLALMRNDAGDHDGVERLYRQSAAAGNRLLLEELGTLREQIRDREDTERLARHAADAGNTLVLPLLAVLRNDMGDHEGAERLRTWWRRGLDADGNLLPDNG